MLKQISVYRNVFQQLKHAVECEFVCVRVCAKMYEKTLVVLLHLSFCLRSSTRWNFHRPFQKRQMECRMQTKYTSRMECRMRTKIHQSNAFEDVCVLYVLCVVSERKTEWKK